MAAESTRTLLLRERPEESLPGIVLAAFGVVYIAAREGVENWQAEHVDDCC